jgi:integrase/recombinase XerD
MSYIKYSQKKGKSKLSIQHELLAIRHYFNYLMKAGKIKSNPAQGVYIRYNVRIVQYMSGHKYVSSTERYQSTHLEDLKEQLRRFHPLG